MTGCRYDVSNLLSSMNALSMDRCQEIRCPYSTSNKLLTSCQEHTVSITVIPAICCAHSQQCAVNSNLSANSLAVNTCCQYAVNSTLSAALCQNKFAISSTLSQHTVNSPLFQRSLSLSTACCQSTMSSLRAGHLTVNKTPSTGVAVAAPH